MNHDKNGSFTNRSAPVSFTCRCTLYCTFKVSERFQASFVVSNCTRPWFKWKSFFKITQRFFSKGLQHKVGGHFFFRLELSAHCSRFWQSHSIQPKCLLYRADAPRWGHGDLSQISELKYNRYKTAAARRWDSWLLERFLKASISRKFQYRPIT